MRAENTQQITKTSWTQISKGHPSTYANMQIDVEERTGHCHGLREFISGKRKLTVVLQITIFKITSTKSSKRDLLEDGNRSAISLLEQSWGLLRN